MEGDRIAHAVGELKGSMDAVVREISETRQVLNAHSEKVAEQGEQLATVIAKLDNLPCEAHTKEIGKIRWGFVKLVLYLVGAGGAGGGIAAVISQLVGG